MTASSPPDLEVFLAADGPKARWLADDGPKARWLADDGPKARWSGTTRRCAVGRGGIALKQGEGDGITPVGRWPMRRLLYRADRLARPKTLLPCQAIAPEYGWCDDPADAAYNQPVRLPYPASHE